MFGIEPLYLVFAIPGILLSLFASLYTKSTFSKYSEEYSSKGLTGAEAADRLLRSNGVDDVKIEMTEGFLSDHYDPMSKTLRLSPDVYGKSSLSAIGVACHEAGHAIQHARSYAPLYMRSALVPATNISSMLAYPLFFIGLFLHSQGLILFGIILFSVAVLFAIVTLPVEWDASARAKKLMVEDGIVSQQEASAAGAVLNAAFLTYLAAAIGAMFTLLYFLYKAGMLGNSSRDE